MHVTLNSAKAYSEKRRVQGAVFNIKEIPGLVFKSEKGCIVVTQINSQNPLMDYSSRAIPGNVTYNAGDDFRMLDNYMYKGAKMIKVVRSFESDSRYWKTPPPIKNSVIITATDNPDIKFIDLSGSARIIRTSFSNGNGYSLGWSENETNIISNGVFNILSKYA